MRSPDYSQSEPGWKKVSKELIPLVTETTEQLPDVYETKTENNTLFVRLSDIGNILYEYCM